jgi:hypothetical protein
MSDAFQRVMLHRATVLLGEGNRIRQVKEC